MAESVLLTVLVENSVCRGNLKAEHGLAFHLRTRDGDLLFDTGQTDLIIHNARLLGVWLESVRAIVLSHGHYDHTGGLPSLFSVASNAAVYAHPKAHGARFVRNSDGTTRPVGMPASALTAIQRPLLRRFDTIKPVEVLPGVYLTGEVPRHNSFEDVGGPFVLDEAGTVPDPILDDQAVFFETRNGIVVLLGCAHAGVVNTLQHVLRLTNGAPVHAVLGGMHLLNANAERINRTVSALRELNVRQIGPAHCTGHAATARLWHEFAPACVPCCVGTRLSFER